VSRCCHYVIHSCYAFYRFNAAKSSSCPGLTRASIDLRKSLTKKMDRRIKSGDDAVNDRTGAARASVTVSDPLNAARTGRPGDANARKPENFPRCLSIQNHTVNCAHRGEGPLSQVAAPYAAKRWGSSWG
jgi:hypothetical protein